MRKILVVDDEEDVLKVLEKRLSSSGYQVIKVKNGQEAIEKAYQELPNLILLDIFLPDMDGGEVAQQLRGNENTKDIPVIFLSCLFTKEDERKGGHLRAGNFFVAKPFEFDELLDIINRSAR